MKYPGGKTVTFAPVSPAGAPWSGTTNSDGSMLIVGTRPYLWDATLGAYKWQEPGDPPGDWHYIWPLDLGYYVKSWAAASTMTNIPTEVGQAGAA